MFYTHSFTDNEIVNSIFKSDKSEDKCIEFILKKNRKTIYSYVLSNNGGKDDAELVLTEGVTQLIFNIRKETFRGDSSVSTYLYTICKRVWLKMLKKESRYVDFVQESPYSSENEDSPLDIFSEKELTSEVGALLSKIGEGCKSVLELWTRHYSMTEISVQMNYKNAQIAMNKKNKCLSRLKEIVSENAGIRENLKSYIY